MALLGGAASALGTLLLSLVDHYYFNIEFPHMAALFWLVAAMTLAAARIQAQNRRAASQQAAG
jgi:hypothetical protein